jgi:hypothetical protein
MPIPISEQEDWWRDFPPEMLVPIYQNTRGHAPKHNNIHVFLKTLTNLFIPEVTLTIYRRSADSFI